MRLANGLFRLVLSDGYELTTHGADPAGHGASMGIGDPERNPVCAGGNTMHVLYSYPAVIGSNRVSAVATELRASVRRMNAVLNEAALLSGGVSADYRVLCDDFGEIRVDAFANSTIAPYFTNIVESARAAGFNDPDVDYLIFYDDNFPGICGFGQLFDDTRPDASNRNNTGGYGVTYRSCWNSRTPMHENGHTQGAVQDGAPGADGTGHCVEHEDVMCYPSTDLTCPDQIYFDCLFDTYFDAAPETGEWLATHWNIGSRANRYIVFGGTTSGSTAPVAPGPTPTPSASSAPTPTSTPSPTPSPSESPSESPDPAPDRIDPVPTLYVKPYRPERGKTFRLKLGTEHCEGLVGTKIRLQRELDGSFRTVATRKLDDSCKATVRMKARFRSATFRTYWPEQHAAYFASYSGTRKVIAKG